MLWGDFDGDGLDDAYVITPTAAGRLLRNRGDGTLEDVTESAGLDVMLLPRLAAWCDLDRDLDLDLFVGTHGGRNHVWINQGSAGFTDATEGSGLAFGLAQRADFVDYDRDGLPDLHLETGEESLLYRNLGGALFERVDLPRSGASASAGGPAANLAADSHDLGVPASTPHPAPDETNGAKVARAPAPPIDVAAPLDIGGLPPGGTADATPFPACALALEDQGGTGCLFGSSIPMLGRLYPLSSNLYVDAATGRVGLGTVAPSARLHVAGNAILGDTDIRGQLDLENGGVFEMFDNTGAQEKVELHPDLVGGAALSMRNEAGNTSLFLDSDWANLGDARLQMQNGAGLQTVDIDAGTTDDGGDLLLSNDAGDVTIHLDGDNATYGSGSVGLFNDAGLSMLNLLANPVGFVELRNAAGSPSLFIDGGTVDNGAEMEMMATDGSFTITFDANDVSDAGRLVVRNDTTETTVEVLGDNANDAGRINLWNRNGATSDNSVLISARDVAATGSEIQLTTGNGANIVTIDLDGQNGVTGQLQINETDGSAALRFLGSDLDLYNAAGASTINFDRVTGTKSAVVDTPSFGERLFYAMEAPEVWFEDFGSARIERGETRIELDPIFLESVTIDAEHPMKVFVTPDGLTPGLYVEKGLDHFVVREQPGGSGAVGFDWRIVAKRKGLEALRLERPEPTPDEGAPLDRTTTPAEPLENAERKTRAPAHAPRPATSQTQVARTGTER
jgi:hypothetical protein